MNIKAIIAIMIIISASLIAANISHENKVVFKKGEYIQINNIAIEFYDYNATAEIEFQLTPFAKFYVFLFGSKTLEPLIKDVFSEFPEVKIQKIGISSASVQLQNVSRKREIYYLHNPINLSREIDALSLIYYGDGKKEVNIIEHASATKAIFYERNQNQVK